MQPALRWLGVLTVASLVVGGFAGLVWSSVAPLPTYTVQGDGHATISERGLASMIAADAWFVVVGLIGGLLLGGAAWRWFKNVGWPVAVIAVGSGLLAGLFCLWLGQLIGPGPFEARLASAQPGDVVPVALRLRSPSALAAWAFAAVGVPLIASSLGPDLRSNGPGRGSRVPAGDDRHGS